MERIEESDRLYRRILPFHLEPDGTISSAAFFERRSKKKPDPECSVYLARLTDADAVRAAGSPGLRVISVPVAAARAVGLDVVHDPLSDDRSSVDYAHCLIKGLSLESECDQLAASTVV